jgi:GNAT superfamily N-acetyltransferase
MPVAAIPSHALTIREYSDELAGAFHDINAEWIGTMFRLEATDLQVLENPRRFIIDPGGAILFVEAAGLGVIGTCALQKTGERSFELTKMGVRTSVRGLKAGEFLLAAVIGRAGALGAELLYLLTNSRCQAAVWASHDFPDTEVRYDDDLGGVRWEGGHLRPSSSTRRSSWCWNEA